MVVDLRCGTSFCHPPDLPFHPMAFTSLTYRVLIASPSDLGEEREAATQAVSEWNAQHAAAESVVPPVGKVGTRSA